MNFKDDNNTAVKNNTLSLDQIAFLNFPTEYLKLSVRLKNFFLSNSFKTFYDIINFNEFEIKMYSNVGSNTVSEIKNLLNRFYLELAMYDLEDYKLENLEVNDKMVYEKIINSDLKFKDIIDENCLNLFSSKENNTLFLKNIIANFHNTQNSLEQHFSDDQLAFLYVDYKKLLISVRSYNFFKENDFVNFADIIHFNPNDLLKRFKNVGRGTVTEVKNLLAENHLTLGTIISDENKLDYIRENYVDRYKSIKNKIDNKFTATFSELNFEEFFKDDREKKIFSERMIGSKTLQELGNEFNVTRERVRQLEIKILKNIISRIGSDKLEENLIKFKKFFETSTSPIYTVDFLFKFPIFRGLEKFDYFNQLISALTSHFVKVKNHLNSIKFDHIKGEVVFLSTNQNKKKSHLYNSILENSYETVFSNLKKIYLNMDNISKFNPEKIKLIMEDELKKLLRPDLISLLDEMINEFEKNNLNYSFLIEQFVLKQNKLLSVKELYNELINDEKQNFTITESYFGNYIVSVENIFEFERGKWGHFKNFSKIDETNCKLISDYIFSKMSENKYLQYNSEKILQELKDDKKFSEAVENLNINLLDRYQISMVLKRSKFYNSEIFYLGRDCWTLDKSNLKRKEIKYLILEILDKKKFPIDLFQLINLIQEQRQLVNDSKDFIQNYILTHCEGIDLIDDLGVIKAILSEWNKENKYKLYQINSSSLNIDYTILKNKIEEYITFNGHSNITSTYVDDENFLLGRRVYYFRKSYHEQRLDVDIINLFESIKGWTWKNEINTSFVDEVSLPSSRITNFDDIEIKIKSFIKKFGHSDIPINFKDDDNYNLGQRIYKLKKGYKKGTLNNDILNQIEKIEGWDWHLDKVHVRSFKVNDLNDLKLKLDKYYQDFGNLEISAHYKDSENYSLGYRIYSIKKKYKVGGLSELEINFLEGIKGWNWEYKTRRVNNINIDYQIELIKRFKLENGHLKVPFDKLIYDYNLSRIIARLRERFKKGLLPEEIIKKLNLIDGWEWSGNAGRGEKIIGSDLNEEKWINFFKCLDDYYLENGNLNFPVSYKVNDLRIGDRLYTIRKLYNEKKEKLHPKLIKKLEAYVGWSWEHHSKTIFKYDDDKVINELKNYYNKNKNFEIHRDTILNDIKLGQLIYRYKRNYKFGKLKPELIMKLEALEGWHW